jgi:hypothetical protein
MLVDMSGKELMRVLQSHAQMYIQKGAFPFFYSGKQLTFERKGKTIAVASTLVPEKVYKVVTFESIIQQSPRFLGTNLNGMATPLKFRLHQGLESFSRFRIRQLRDTSLGQSLVTFKQGKES